MENDDLDYMQTLIAQHNKHTAGARKRHSVLVRGGKTLMFFTIFGGGLLCVILQGWDNFVYVFFVGLALFLANLFGLLEMGDAPNWKKYNREHPHGFGLLFSHFFLGLKHIEDQEYIDNWIAKNQFLLRYGGLDRDKIHLLAGMENYKRMAFCEFKPNIILLQMQAEHRLDTFLHICQKNKPEIPRAVSPMVRLQQFGYFPEIEDHFDFYTEEKGKIAEWIQQNDTVFLELLHFEQFYLDIVFTRSEIYCLINGLERRLITIPDEEVALNEEQVATYFSQLSELQQLINTLQKLR